MHDLYEKLDNAVLPVVLWRSKRLGLDEEAVNQQDQVLPWSMATPLFCAGRWCRMTSQRTGITWRRSSPHVLCMGADRTLSAISGPPKSSAGDLLRRSASGSDGQRIARNVRHWRKAVICGQLIFGGMPTRLPRCLSGELSRQSWSKSI